MALDLLNTARDPVLLTLLPTLLLDLDLALLPLARRQLVEKLLILDALLLLLLMLGDVRLDSADLALGRLDLLEPMFVLIVTLFLTFG